MVNLSFPWAAYILFAVINSFTPGPNVIMLASSGGMWGLRRTLPHLLGVCLGFPVMLVLVQVGLSQVFVSHPWLLNALTVASLAYVTWLAIRIFQMGLGGDLKMASRARPMTFLEASLFQWVNGKAWQVALMTATLFAAHSRFDLFGGAVIYGFVSFAAGITWIELGKRIAAYLARPSVKLAYYSFLALALLLSTWPRGLSQLLSHG